ncbi:protein of unknown function DUF6 transmembrane [Reticulomyxa filosa]|uniref:EamA domain-containing protein n=1 Tax=Reticulomyxa filosa TaxID=46433 RepID=X6NLS7_RETFI|nr:protein of unknown function DUF6 transmembrane [Reticulomyxa filosa]|eukprot:ETO26931.1 protein of unknown function DUF6 transmembrane [Reticulomyxa filosa]
MGTTKQMEIDCLIYSQILGCLCFLLSYFCFALFLIFQKGVVSKWGSFRCVFLFLTFAFISIAFIASYFHEHFQRIRQMTFFQSLAMMYGGLSLCTILLLLLFIPFLYCFYSCLSFFFFLGSALVVSSVPNVLNAFAIKRTSPALAGLFVNLQPFITIFLASLILGERMALLQYFGGMFIVIGVCFGAYGQKIEEDKKTLAKQVANMTNIEDQQHQPETVVSPQK